VKRGKIAFVVVGVLGLLLAWNSMILSPKGRQRAEVKAKIVRVRSEAATLRSEVTDLKAQVGRLEAAEAALERISRLIPADDGMADLIRVLDDVAAKSQVAWASLNPGSPTPGPNGTYISLGISLSGTFFQILDYLERLEEIDRLIVLDGVRLSPGGAAGGTQLLQVNLDGRVFVAGPLGGAPAAGAPLGSTTPAAAEPLASAVDTGGQ
jgi:Tfp pilus assembly protein PilO